MADEINVKEIMKSIKKSHLDYPFNEQKVDLKKRVSERKKSPSYEKNKKFLDLDKTKDIVDNFDMRDFEHNLHQSNLTHTVNEIHSIQSRRNKLVRWATLKFRNITQAEIRFTLDPILRNQERHNSFLTKTLNQIRNYIKNNIKQIDYLNNKVEKQNNKISMLSNEIFPKMDFKYLDFENEFRGSREEISKRQEKYGDIIEKSYQKLNSKVHLDIGCGRGEFLTELNKRNIPNKGVDNNSEMIQFCKKQNLDVIFKDANSYLRSIQDNSLVGVSGFQFVEHVTPHYLLDFFQLCYQKIADGGIIILETVNPMSLFSLMHFWYDVSHQKPIPPDVLKFYLDQSGFEDLELIFSADVPNSIKLTGDDENTKKLNELLFGPQDYSIIGRKKSQ